MPDPIQSRELRGAVWRAARERIYALAGDGQGRVRAQPGKIWVRIPGVGLTTAWCVRFMPRHDQPVWLERRPEDGSLEVVDQWLSEAAQPMPMIVPHRSMHEEGGSDPIRVTSGMIQPLRVYPTDPPGRAVFVAKGMVIKGDGSVVEAGGGSVPLTGFEDGEVAWIVVRDGMVQAVRELRPLDIPLAEVTVSDAITFIAIRDRRQFVSPWVSVSASDIRLAGDVEGPVDETRVVGLQGRPVSDAVPGANDALIWDAGSGTWRPRSPSVSLSGDVNGPNDNTRVIGLQGRPVSNATPSANDALIWDAMEGAWKPGQQSVSLSGDVEGPNNNARVVGLQSRPISNAAPNPNDALIWDATNGMWKPDRPSVSLAGDVEGPSSNTTVMRIRGRPVADQNPNPNDVLTWDGVAGMWKPAPPPSGGGGGGTSGPWVLRALYNPQFPNTTMFPTRVGYTNETFQDVSGGLGILFARMTNTGGNGWILRLKTIPVIPIRVICGFSDLATGRADRDIGLVMYHAGSGKIIAATAFREGWRVSRWTNYSTFSSNAASENASRHRANIIFGFDITSTGYSVLYYIMPDLALSVFSENFSFFGAPPTHIGIGVAHLYEVPAGWFWHWVEIPL